MHPFWLRVLSKWSFDVKADDFRSFPSTAKICVKIAFGLQVFSSRPKENTTTKKKNKFTELLT